MEEEKNRISEDRKIIEQVIFIFLKKKIEEI